MSFVAKGLTGLRAVSAMIRSVGEAATTPCLGTRATTSCLAAADWLEGGEGADTLIGGFGDDTLSGGNGEDLLEGSAGNGGLRGGNGDDTFHDGIGEDTLLGRAENDVLRSTEFLPNNVDPGGDQSINGGFGDDQLIADRADTLTGADGVDSFFHFAEGDAEEVGYVSDFDPANKTLNVLVRDGTTGNPFPFTLRDSPKGLEVLIDGVVEVRLADVTIADAPVISAVTSNS